MSLRAMIDRKLVLMVVSPLARALLSALVGYMGAKGVPADLIDQFAAAIGGAAVVGFNIVWELIDRQRAERRAALQVRSDIAPLVLQEYHDIVARREAFEREAG